MNRIAVAGNVVPPVYHLILEKGYRIKFKDNYIVATKNNIELIAQDFVELGGLVFLFENKGENWKVSDDKIDDCLTFIEQNQ
ncbi:hypothetical protein [Tenacibaculum sp. 190524A05c]|uniref:Uncharacterized protein n=1 Tax=Tenacibaculum platacis TaxID=3137852 RepID=A0ABM9NXP1_9FLAO